MRKKVFFLILYVSNQLNMDVYNKISINILYAFITVNYFVRFQIVTAISVS